jgi:ABC-type multidrug transport system fused ATPase/permease subunit
VSECDSLIFLRDGKVAGRGPLESLLQDNSDFRAMANS